MKNKSQTEIFGNKTLQILEIEFPLYLKNIRRDGKSNIFWRYHEDGRWEVIIFGKLINCFQYGRNEYWQGKDGRFEGIFMTRQVELNQPSSEAEFISKFEELIALHSNFLGNTRSINEFKEEEKIEKVKPKKKAKAGEGKNIDGIIVKDNNEEDPF